jgi:hypothetical protein
MSGRQKNRICGLFLPLLILAAEAARADQTASYDVSGSSGAALWGLGNQPGTAALLFAFSRAAPVKAAATAGPAVPDNSPAPGPRVGFLVMQWALTDNAWVEREWYGDWPLADNGLVVGADLAQGSLDTMVLGTLVVSSGSGTDVQRNVPGRLQVSWQASSDPANTTTAYTYQTPAYTAALQTIGSGRMATATATITLPALGAPISLSGVGSLSSITTGALNLTLQ